MFGNVAFSQAPFDAFAGNTISVSVSEAAAAQEAQSIRGAITALLAELATAQLVAAARLTVSRASVAESVAAIVSAPVVRGALRNTVSESAALADTVTTIGSLHPVLDESVRGADTAAVNTQVRARRQEAATIFDQPAGRRLWEPIIDTQGPNWVIIPTTPT